MNSTKIEPKYISKSNPRVGLIALASDFMIEKDFINVIKDRDIDFFVNRIECYNPLTKENLIKMSNKVTEVTKDILPDQDIDCVVYGCTSGTVAIGENIIANQIYKSKPNTYVTTPITAALKAFSNLNIKKISVLTPYPKTVNETVFNYLLKNNINVLNFSSFNLNYDSEIAKVEPKHIIKTIKNMEYRDSDAIFVSCTALRIVEVLQEAEDDINKIIISSNQSIIWDSLRLSNTNDKINGFGQLFKLH